MRPQQQGRRQRNRSSGGNNRRNQNPLSRNYESNGPDVKIRGNAQVVADKYATLARDAISSGDYVMAENYLQHAEHYNRIIMAAQAQMQTQRDERQQSDDQDDSSDSDDGNTSEASDNRGTDGGRESQERDRQDGGRQNRERTDRNRQNRERAEVRQDASSGDETDASQAPQPVIGETPAEVTLEEQEQAASGRARRATPRRPRKPRNSEAAPSATDDDNKGEDAGETVAAEV
jgi:Domain of unknown function (DUF4167)